MPSDILQKREKYLLVFNLTKTLGKDSLWWISGTNMAFQRQISPSITFSSLVHNPVLLNVCRPFAAGDKGTANSD